MSNKTLNLIEDCQEIKKGHFKRDRYLNYLKITKSKNPESYQMLQ